MGAVLSLLRPLVRLCVEKGSVRTSLIVAAVAYWLVRAWNRRHRRRIRHRWDYEAVVRLLHDCREPLPAMLVHLGAFDANVSRFADIAARAGKTIRVATKSVRVPWLIFRMLRMHPKVYQGLMCFSAREAQFLATVAPAMLEGSFDAVAPTLDYLVAYPNTQEADLEAAWDMVQSGERLHLMVDCVQHVRDIDVVFASKNRERDAELPRSDALTCRLCIDVDMSYRPAPFVHLGAHRSPCRSVADVLSIVDEIQHSSYCRLSAVMGYEAQIAGLPDANPFTALMNPALAALKRISMADVMRKRKEIREALEERGVAFEVFNGGGSGELARCAADPSITEVAAGSGFLQSGIFDWFGANHNEPALAFALRATRSCDKGILTCQSGGFIASGETSVDKSPSVFLPRGLSPFPMEGFGEVQTPLAVAPGTDGARARIGDPILFRPAKAGEIAERFREYIVVGDKSSEGGAGGSGTSSSSELRVVQRAMTYRGLEMAFF